MPSLVEVIAKALMEFHRPSCRDLDDWKPEAKTIVSALVEHGETRWMLPGGVSYHRAVLTPLGEAITPVLVLPMPEEPGANDAS